MKLSDKAEDIFAAFFLAVIIILTIAVAAAEEATVEWVLCSDLSGECVDYRYPSRLACENQRIPNFYCVPVNYTD